MEHLTVSHFGRHPAQPKVTVARDISGLFSMGSAEVSAFSCTIRLGYKAENHHAIDSFCHCRESDAGFNRNQLPFATPKSLHFHP